MHRAARVDHPEVHQIVPSHHCVLRFRQRRPFRGLGEEAVADALIASLERADVSGWPPAWALNDGRTKLWAVNGELAFPLEPTENPGNFLATTCLSRDDRSRPLA